MQADGSKVGYVEWQHFRQILHELRKHHSSAKLSTLFGNAQNGGPLWAEAAAQHRSVVSEADVKRSRELVDELEEQKKDLEERKKDEALKRELDSFQPEIQRLLLAIYEKVGTWRAVSRALGKNPSTSGYYKNIATGKTRASAKLLKLLRATDIENLEATPPRVSKNEATGRTADRDDVAPQQQEKPQKVAKEPAPEHVPEPQPVTTAPVLAEPVPWPAYAQEHLHIALRTVEDGTKHLPKTMRKAAADAIEQIKLAIEELSVD